MCLKLQLIERLSQQEWVAATTDGWTDQNLHRFIGLTLHYINDDWRLEEIFAACSNLLGCSSF